MCFLVLKKFCGCKFYKFYGWNLGYVLVKGDIEFVVKRNFCVFFGIYYGFGSYLYVDGLERFLLGILNYLSLFFWVYDIKLRSFLINF